MVRLFFLMAILLGGGIASPLLAYDSVSVARLVGEQALRCWAVPEGFEGRSVTVELVLLGDGSLADGPQVASVTLKAQSKLAPFIDSALRAVQRCAPFQGLGALAIAPQERLDLRIVFRS